MDIRRLTPSDAPAYRALRLRALREHPDAFTSDYEESERQPVDIVVKRLDNPAQKLWGAFNETREMCGMVGLNLEAGVKSKHKATLVGMYVAPEQAGGGAGRALVETALLDARQSGLELLVLTVTEGNSGAIQLYKRAGFTSFGVEPRAIRIEGRYWSKNHMFMHLKPA